MTSARSFRVVIVGGGVAGLSLANMLQSFDIDYVLLEAHNEIAPPVGASIGLLPNGLLILDQLGCYEPLQAVSGSGAIKNAHIRTREGRSVSCSKDMLSHVEKRHGYPVLFFDRQWLLQILYDRLRHKDRILLRKKVHRIEQLDDAVRVWTTDGESVTGDMIVGADGIHSTVRREMRRLADKDAPGYLPSGEEDRVPCYYQCSFGIAQDVDGWPDGDQTFTTGQGQSFLVASGPERRCYWFMFNKLEDVKYGSEIPRYSKQDEARLVRRYAHLPIMEGLTFGQIYAKRITSALTPLHEVVFDKWFFQRIVLMGDSAHKPNPIGGMGGNGAIETAAEFINALLAIKDKRSNGLGGLTVCEIESVSREMQSARHKRAKALVADSHAVQALYAFENPLASNIFLRFLLPLVGSERLLERMASNFVGGSRLKHLPIPPRPRAIPFDHELPAIPVKPLLAGCVRVAFALVMGLVLLLSTRPWRESLNLTNSWGELELTNTTRLEYTPLSVIRQRMSTVFFYPALSTSPDLIVHVVFALSQLVSPLLIYTIEGYRVGNHGTLLSLPSLVLFAMEVLGIERIAPIYAVLASLQSFQRPAGRFVGTEVTQALVPALILAYIVPTIMMLTLARNTNIWQVWIAVWLSSPLLFSAMTAVLSSGPKRWQRRRDDNPKTANVVQDKQCQQKDDSQFDRYKNDDVPVLKSVFHYAFAMQAIVYMATLGYSCLQSEVPLVNMFLATPTLFTKGTALPTALGNNAAFFSYNMGFAAAGFIGQGLYAIWDLRRLGYVTNKDAAMSCLAFLGGQVVFGPGATLAGLWSWREGVISGLSALHRSR